MRAVGPPAVVALHEHLGAVAIDRDRARALEQLHTAREELLLEHRCDFGILRGQNLLTRDDQRHLRAERAEHVRELHAGDARTDHDEVVGDLRWRIRLSGREDAFAVGDDPLGKARSRTGRDEDGVGVDLLGALRGIDRNRVGTHQPTGSGDHADALRLQEASHRFVQPGFDRRNPLAQRFAVEVALGAQSHHPGAGQLRQLTTGGDHRLRRDAVPEVRGAADDVAFDEGHFGAKGRRDRRRGVAGRTAAEDHKPYGHRLQRTERGRSGRACNFNPCLSFATMR